MSKFITPFASVVLIASAFFSTPAFAKGRNHASAAAVLGACDRTAGCSYTQNPNGDISGCSQKSGTCFYCSADGKGQCFQVRKRGSRGKLGNGTIGGVKLAPPPPRYRQPVIHLHPASGNKLGGTTPSRHHRSR